MSARRAVAIAALCVLAACRHARPEPAADPEAATRAAVKQYIARQLGELRAAALELARAAPAPDADGWTEPRDRPAIARMQQSWRRCRAAYERVEGAIAVLFPAVDRSLDARYTDALSEHGPDADLFDAQGFTGMHAVERILWADAAPSAVVAFESRHPGYAPAAFPRTAREARDFRDALVARIASDAGRMEREFAPLELDAPAAFRGVIGSMREQTEKVALAATTEEESRYAQATLADMRANLAGGRELFALFRPWLASARVDGGGAALADAVDARFAALARAYDALPGDALPALPEGWDPDAPSGAHAATPYGRLHALVSREADPRAPGSLVDLLGRAADALAIPRLPAR